MADRSPYSIPAEMLPKSASEDIDSRFSHVSQPAGYALALGIGGLGVLTGAITGAMPWGATDPRTIVAAALFLWGMTVSTAAIADCGRTTIRGLFASMLLQFGTSAGLAKALLPAVFALTEERAYLWLFAVLFLVSFPVLAAPLSLRRMRETLWQDVSYSMLDSTLMALGVVKRAWWLQHLGDFHNDRYGIVETGAERKNYFVIDKMRGRLAGVSDPETAEKAMGMLGYAVEHIIDKSHTIRIHEYSIHSWDDIQFVAPPARGITAEEYYQRI